MPLRSPTAVRLVRAAVACVLLLLLAVPASTASAAGTGGIEVTPVPAEVDGRPVTSFRVAVPRDGDREVPFLLRNVDPGERSARLFVAPVTRSGDSFALGEPDASPYVSFEAQDVTLAEGEARELTFTVRGGGDLPDDEVLAAVVVQVGSGSVVQRASTLIYLSPGSTVPLPVLLLLVAGALVAAVGAAVLLVGRRRAE